MKKITLIFNWLERTYPEAKCSLDFKNPFELLVATILSAQCTDERVNKVTPALFKHYGDACSLAKAPLSKIEKLIQSTGFFRAKAKSLKEMTGSLVRDHGGAVPQDLEALVKLRGVGRKTANVVRGNAFNLPGFPVDTHVGRLTRRIGLTTQKDPVKVEEEITQMLPPEKWSRFSNLLIFHGRAICDARKPLCDECGIARYCERVGVQKSER